MKKLILLFLLISFLSTAKAQYVTIPDSNFRTFLKNYFPSCVNSNGMLDTTCSTMLNDTALTILFSDSAVNLDGIQYFKSLKNLDCSDVGIETIPALPSSLISFACRNNMLKNLPTLPSGLVYLDCVNNQLTSLPSLDDSLKGLDCAYNNIYCLPFLPSVLQTLIIDSSKIHCLPNAINENTMVLDYGHTNLHLPICNSTFGYNACPVYNYSIYGQAFFDNNNDGIWDYNEPVAPNLKIKLTGNSSLYNTVTSQSGYYYFLPATSGNYTLTADSVSQLYKAVPLSNFINFTGPDTAAEVDIALQSALSNPDSLFISGSGNFVTGDTYTIPNMPPTDSSTLVWYNGSIVVNYENDGLATVSPTITLYYDSSLYKYINSDNSSVVNTGTSLILNVQNLTPGVQQSFTAYFADSATIAQLGAGNILLGPDQYYTNATIIDNDNGNAAALLIQVVGLLPLKLISFTGSAAPNNATLLLWSTANETNTKSFVIQKSTDGLHFTDIATVNAKGVGNNNYNYSAVAPNASVVYYRLKMIDKNGNFSYSIVVTVKTQKDIAASIGVFPNPANCWINIKTDNTSLINTTARVINSVGVAVKNILLTQGTQKVDVRNLPAGLYFIQTQLTTKKIIINR